MPGFDASARRVRRVTAGRPPARRPASPTGSSTTGRGPAWSCPTVRGAAGSGIAAAVLVQGHPGPEGRQAAARHRGLAAEHPGRRRAPAGPRRRRPGRRSRCSPTAPRSTSAPPPRRSSTCCGRPGRVRHRGQRRAARDRAVRSPSCRRAGRRRQCRRAARGRAGAAGGRARATSRRYRLAELSSRRTARESPGDPPGAEGASRPEPLRHPGPRGRDAAGESSPREAAGAPKGQPSPEPLRHQDRAGRRLWRADGLTEGAAAARPGRCRACSESEPPSRGPSPACPTSSTAPPFADRHIGPRPDEPAARCSTAIGFGSLDELIDAAVPAGIRDTDRRSTLPAGRHRGRGRWPSCARWPPATRSPCR